VEPLEHLLQRGVDLEVVDHLRDVGLHARQRLVRELHLHTVDRELDRVGELRARADRDRIAALCGDPNGLDRRVVGNGAVEVEDQVEVGVLVRVAGRDRAGQQRRCRLSVLHLESHEPLREVPQPLPDVGHLAIIATGGSARGPGAAHFVRV
jgi:hypothetical protein